MSREIGEAKMTCQVQEALQFPAWKGPLQAQHDRRHGPTPGTLHVKLPNSGAKKRPSKLPGGKVVPPRTSRMAWESSETAAKARKRTSPCRDWKEEFRARTRSRAAYPEEAENKGPGDTWQFIFHAPSGEESGGYASTKTRE